MNGSTDYLGGVSPRLHPICRTDRWGKNPFLDNTYRVVFAPSRLGIVGGRWEDNGRAEYRMLPLYEAQGWILERWLSPMEYCGIGPERWEIDFRDPDTMLLVSGPYPSRGEYVMCWDFENNEPTQGFVNRVIGMINAGRLRPFNEHRKAIIEHSEKRKQARRNRIADEIRDALPSFQAQPLSGPNGTIRGFKTRPENLAAEDVRFGGRPVPVRNNAFVSA